MSPSPHRCQSSLLRSPRPIVNPPFAPVGATSRSRPAPRSSLCPVSRPRHSRCVQSVDRFVSLRALRGHISVSPSRRLAVSPLPPSVQSVQSVDHFVFLRVLRGRFLLRRLAVSPSRSFASSTFRAIHAIRGPLRDSSCPSWSLPPSPFRRFAVSPLPPSVQSV